MRANATVTMNTVKVTTEASRGHETRAMARKRLCKQGGSAAQSTEDTSTSQPPRETEYEVARNNAFAEVTEQCSEDFREDGVFSRWMTETLALFHEETLVREAAGDGS